MFGRRTPPDPVVEEQEELDVAQGKGRATPKRKEAEAARKKRMTPPRNRKEASALHRERVKEQRGKQREAMAGVGDDRFLPARDQGPVKKLIRDYIDSRRTIGEFLIPVFLVMFVVAIRAVAASPQYIGTFAWLAVLALLAVDSVRIVRGVKTRGQRAVRGGRDARHHDVRPDAVLADATATAAEVDRTSRRRGLTKRRPGYSASSDIGP